LNIPDFDFNNFTGGYNDPNMDASGFPAGAPPTTAADYDDLEDVQLGAPSFYAAVNMQRALGTGYRGP